MSAVVEEVNLRLAEAAQPFHAILTRALTALNPQAQQQQGPPGPQQRQLGGPQHVGGGVGGGYSRMGGGFGGVGPPQPAAAAPMINSVPPHQAGVFGSELESQCKAARVPYFAGCTLSVYTPRPDAGGGKGCGGWQKKKGRRARGGWWVCVHTVCGRAWACVRDVCMR